MSKELEALTRLFLIANKLLFNGISQEEDYKLVKFALKRLEELERENQLLKSEIKECATRDEKQEEILRTIKEHFIKIGGYKGNFESGQNEILISLKDLTQEKFDLLEGYFKH